MEPRCLVYRLVKIACQLDVQKDMVSPVGSLSIVYTRVQNFLSARSRKESASFDGYGWSP